MRRPTCTLQMSVIYAGSARMHSPDEFATQRGNEWSRRGDSEEGGAVAREIAAVQARL